MIRALDGNLFLGNSRVCFSGSQGGSIKYFWGETASGQLGSLNPEPCWVLGLGGTVDGGNPAPLFIP